VRPPDGGLKDQLRSRTIPTFGAWTSLGHPSITEIFTRSGVDFVGIDLEHSTISQEQTQRIIATAHAGGAVCLPRVASHNGEQIQRVLDSGAGGILVPNVSSVEEIRRLVEWVKYPPMGKRSFGVARAQGYGFDFDQYTQNWNERSILLIQIESIQSVEIAPELLAHDAVDGVMIGPYDISGSLGVPGQLQHPRLTQACSRVILAARQLGKACGTQIVEPTPESVSAAFSEGYTFVVLASDIFVLWKWSERMQQTIEQVRSHGVETNFSKKTF